uniref:Uncharacterized protein n=1 Tax=Triticum urartu TaxID=4572 RepID=A0A8R7P660_TRIUA
HESHRRRVASVDNVDRLGDGGGGEEERAAERAAGLGAEPGVDALRVEAVAAGRERLHLVPGHQRADADRALHSRRLLLVSAVALVPGRGARRRGGGRAVERDWQPIDGVGVEAGHGRRRGGRGRGLAVGVAAGAAAAARPAEVEADGDEGDEEGEQAGQQRHRAAAQREVAVVDVAVPHPLHLVRRPRGALLRGHRFSPSSPRELCRHARTQASTCTSLDFLDLSASSS